MLDELLPPDPDEPIDRRLQPLLSHAPAGHRMSSIKTTSGDSYFRDYGLFPLRKDGTTIEH